MAESPSPSIRKPEPGLTRDAVAFEQVPGGFPAVYPVLRALEEAGRIRRGYFVAGLGGLQFAEPGALDAIRAARDPDPESPQAVVPGRGMVPVRVSELLADIDAASVRVLKAVPV